MTVKSRANIYDLMDYRGPVGEGPAGWEVDVVESDPFHDLGYTMQGRPPGKGPFHVLRHEGALWMSDTAAEKRDHVETVWKISNLAAIAGRAPVVLIHGLGLGLVVAAALRLGSTVDVVEIDQDLAEWMEPWLQELASESGGQLTIHVADAYEKKWPVGTRWDIVWHDIWPDICEDHLPDMHRLHRSYGQRADWQGSWGRRLAERVRRGGYGWL